MTDQEALQIIIELYGKWRINNYIDSRYEKAIAHIGIRLGEAGKPTMIFPEDKTSKPLEIRY